MSKAKICLSCLTRDHIGHKVVEGDENEKERKKDIVQKLYNVKQRVERKKTMILNAKVKVQKK